MLFSHSCLLVLVGFFCVFSVVTGLILPHCFSISLDKQWTVFLAVVSDFLVLHKKGDFLVPFKKKKSDMLNTK